MTPIKNIFDREKWYEIFSALKQNKLRTFFTAFGVFWGIFMLVIMLGSGSGLRNGVTQDMGDMATNSLFMWTQRTTMPYKGFPRGRQYYFNNDDTEALKKKVPEIAYIAPRLRVRGGENDNNVIRGRETGVFEIFGDVPEYNLIDPMQILKGRYINPIDINNFRKTAVIGLKVKETLFKENEKVIGETIRIQGVYFTVVGFFKSKKTGRQAEREEQAIFIPFSTLQRTYNYGNIVGWYSITSKATSSAAEVETKCKALLRQRHRIHPDDERAIGSFNVEKQYKKMTGLFLGINVLIWIVGTGTLFAGIVGVSNIMLIIVKERTKEIGIQRALGATPFNIMSQIILESILLTTLAGYIGLVIGTGLIELINYILVTTQADTGMFKRPEIDFSIATTAIILLVFSGMIAGLIPAKKAVSIKPIDALRNE